MDVANEKNTHTKKPPIFLIPNLGNYRRVFTSRSHLREYNDIKS